MGNSVLVFVSHSSEDKEEYVEPIVQDMEDSYINVWIDTKKILPGDNLRKSIFRDGLDKADIVLLFFTNKSLKSSWVDKEIKHVLRDEGKKGNNFDLNKIISIFDSKETYDEIYNRYPELTDDLLHLMPQNYNKKHLGQLISAIWSKYLSLQGGDIETQKQLLAKDKESFQKDKEIQDLKQKILNIKSKNSNQSQYDEFEKYYNSKRLEGFLKAKEILINSKAVDKDSISNLTELISFGLVEYINSRVVAITKKGKDFVQWYILEKETTLSS